MKHESTNAVATIIFSLAILHTFLVGNFNKMAARARPKSTARNLLHILGEVEIVFGAWAALLCLFLYFGEGSSATLAYLDGLSFTEPFFVFAIMIVASTRPVVESAQDLMFLLPKILPIRREFSTFLCCLIIGPLLGSFITEPAAMTVTALILRERYFDLKVSQRFKYSTVAALFVNVSIGGVLTPFAAPPVLMVAGTWNWGLCDMLSLFGWKAVIAVTINAALVTFVLRKELLGAKIRTKLVDSKKSSPFVLKIIHLIFLFFIVLNVHHLVVFVGALLFFLGLASATRHLQEDLKIRESLLVAFFLGGLVILGGLQEWWLRPLIQSLKSFPLFLGATFLTAITDNAALTYLGSQVESIPDSFKYALVAGAISGGGLTVIANAPNPAGYSILQRCFGEKGIEPTKLFLHGLIPTVIAMACFWLL
jgi:Na+/H+ antiporter NhaD/arsenite permease-like protein